MIPLDDLIPGKECCRAGWIAAALLAALLLVGLGTSVVLWLQRDRARLERDQVQAELKAQQLVLEGYRSAQQEVRAAATRAAAMQQKQTDAVLKALSQGLPATDEEARAWALKAKEHTR